MCRVRLHPFPGRARRTRRLNPRGSGVGPPGRVATRAASIPERGCAPRLARPRGRGRESGNKGNPLPPPRAPVELGIKGGLIFSPSEGDSRSAVQPGRRRPPLLPRRL